MSDTRPFVVPQNRQQITKEPELQGRWSQQFPDMIGFRNQGGGKVPADFAWRTNPKQWQEELTEESLTDRATKRRLPSAG